MYPFPPLGSIHFIFSGPLRLEIPITNITSLCTKPRKYLTYLGWCILGAPGLLANSTGSQIGLDGDLEDRATYIYILPSGVDILSHAIDLETIKTRSSVPVQLQRRRQDFVTKLRARDGRCVWTGVSDPEGMHIIPHRRGDSVWFRAIIADRAESFEPTMNPLLNMDDIKNGLCASPTVHAAFGRRSVAILKTPNLMLTTSDVPERCERVLRDGQVYPVNKRYTFQSLSQANAFDMRNNTDAAFVNAEGLDNRLPIDCPSLSDLILHYYHGPAIALEWWGKGTEVLATRAGIPRPPPPPVPTMGPSASSHDRTVAIAKRAAGT